MDGQIAETDKWQSKYAECEVQLRRANQEIAQLQKRSMRLEMRLRLKEPDFVEDASPVKDLDSSKADKSDFIKKAK